MFLLRNNKWSQKMFSLVYSCDNLNTMLAINNVEVYKSFLIICWTDLTLPCELLIMWHWWLFVVMLSLEVKCNLYVSDFSSKHVYAILLRCISWEYFLWHDECAYLEKNQGRSEIFMDTRKLGTNASFFNSILVMHISI